MAKKTTETVQTDRSDQQVIMSGAPGDAPRLPPNHIMCQSIYVCPGERRPRQGTDSRSPSERTRGLDPTSPTGPIVTDSVDDMPKIRTIFPNAGPGDAARSPTGLLIIVVAMLIVYAASATTATAAHAVFQTQPNIGAMTAETEPSDLAKAHRAALAEMAYKKLRLVWNSILEPSPAS